MFTATTAASAPEARMRTKLTDALLDRLEPRPARYEVTDTDVPCFGVRVSPSGERVFFVLYTVRGQGRQRRLTIGPYGRDAWRLSTPRGAPKDYRTARDEARRIIGLVAHGEDPQGERMGERGALAFEELALRYLVQARRQKRTWQQDLRQIGGFRLDEQGELEVDPKVTGYLLPAWRGRTAAGIRKRDVLDVLEPVTERAPIAANRLRVLISRIFRWGGEQDLVDHNPTLGTKPPAKERPGQRVLSPRELGEAYRRCAGVGPLGDVVRLLILTWKRRAEVCELALTELRDGLDTWEIPADRMKNKRPDVVPLSSAARGILAARLAVHPGGPRVFLNGAGAPLHPDTVTDYIAELSHAMGGESFTQRDLRRTCTTLCGRLGVSKDIRARLLSHTDPTVTGKHYDRYDYLQEKSEALETWAEYVLELAHSAQVSSPGATSAPRTAPGRRRRTAAAASSAPGAATAAAR